jgi:hypothetical protein
MQLLHKRPEIPFGIHLTLVCDTNHGLLDAPCALAEVDRLVDPVA